MSSTGVSDTDGSLDGRTPGLPFLPPGESLVRISVPPGTPAEARVAIERLLELTTVLAERGAQLQQALDSRIVIEQAKGVLIERYALTPEDAFELLRRAARRSRTKIHDLARDVVASRTSPPAIEESLGAPAGGSRRV